MVFIKLILRSLIIMVRANKLKLFPPSDYDYDWFKSYGDVLCGLEKEVNIAKE